VDSLKALHPRRPIREADMNFQRPSELIREFNHAADLAVAKDFTLHVVRAIMSGRGDEIIDLAKTNLWR
jgi:hypothetical protein